MDIALLFHLVVKMTNLKMNSSFLSVFFFLALSYLDSKFQYQVLLEGSWNQEQPGFLEARWLLQVWLL